MLNHSDLIKDSFSSAGLRNEPLLSSMCIDNFFDDPYDIRKFALEQNFKFCTVGNWPGERTDPLPDTARPFMDYLMNLLVKTGRITYSQSLGKKKVDITASFQIMRPFDDQVDSILNRGFIHHDYTMTKLGQIHLTGIVFLNEHARAECGTSLFQVKPSIESVYTAVDIKRPYYLNHQRKKIEGFDQKLARHFDQFTETQTFNHRFNRMIAFDSRYWHGVTSIHTGQPEGRLTLVFFMSIT